MEKTDHSTLLPPDVPEYLDRTGKIIETERTFYLDNRREQNGLEPVDDTNLTGLAISGGGIRAATLGLGMMQAMIAAGKMRYFDYLSTVSGGGYIGSCLTSLLSDEPDAVDKTGKIPNINHRFDAGKLGVDEANSPFNELNNRYEYKKLDETKLSAKHQLRHLRQHGEYITLNKSVLGWDVRRAIGALTTGIVLNILTFLLVVSVAVLLHHALFALMSNGHLINQLAQPAETLNAQTPPPLKPFVELDAMPDEQWNAMATTEQLSMWIRQKVAQQFMLIGQALGLHPGLAFVFFGFGALIGIIFLLWSRRLPPYLSRRSAAERKYPDEKDQFESRPGETEIESDLTVNFKWWFSVVAYVLGPVTAYVVTTWLFRPTDNLHLDYFVMLALPACFALGLFIAVLMLTAFYLLNQAPEVVSGRIYRSFYHGIQGTAFMGVLVALAFPVMIVMVFGKHGLAVNLLLSLVPVGAAYFFTLKGIGFKSSGDSFMSTLSQKLQMPLLNLSIFLVTAMIFAWISTNLHDLASYIKRDSGDGVSLLAISLVLLALAVVLVIILGFAVNANDVALHYFYRDRLTEAYLRTNGRATKPDADHLIDEGTLMEVNLRNHDQLKLSDLGEGNGRGPYHLIVAALNLQGSNDLAKKALKSDHFIFSKYFIGSRTTGYYRSDRYMNGSTKLSTAMAISAGAVSAGMGVYGFAASNFYMTLLNFRTGFWLKNPLYLHREKLKTALEDKGENVKRTFNQYWNHWFPNMPLWLSYLFDELTGNLDVNSGRVYVSDGGHTGDNLAILPLIQRKCKTIVVADFEEDHKFMFGSFNQAVRLAKSIYDVDIEIDLRPLIPEKNDGNLIISPSSVVTGKIFYKKWNDTEKQIEISEGQLVYMKSTVNLRDDSNGHEPAPVYVLNYQKTNPAFPHDSTADLYFEEVQFEAYRRLGEHIGQQAAAKMSVKMGEKE